MSERILKSSLSVLDAFNHVRNNQSLAHDNSLLGYDEALLIFNNVVNLVRYVRAIETGLRFAKTAPEVERAVDDEIPF